MNKPPPTYEKSPDEPDGFRLPPPEPVKRVKQSPANASKRAKAKGELFEEEE